MIELASHTHYISSSIESVFGYVINMENYKEWFPGVVNIESQNALQHGYIGKTYIEQLVMPQGKVPITITVKKCELNRLFLTQGDLKEVLPQMTVLFEKKDDNHCKVTLQYHSRNPELLKTPNSYAC